MPASAGIGLGVVWVFLTLKGHTDAEGADTVSSTLDNIDHVGWLVIGVILSVTAIVLGTRQR